MSAVFFMNVVVLFLQRNVAKKKTILPTPLMNKTRKNALTS